MMALATRKTCQELLVRLRANSPAPPVPHWDEQANAKLDVILEDEEFSPGASEVPDYERRFVCFMDVLGTSEALRESSSEKSGFSHASGPYGTIHGFVINEQKRENDRETGVQITAFSDNVVISAPATDVGFRRLLMLAHELYCSLVSVNKRVPRGAVALGEAFHESGIVFGPALLEAYEMEHSQVTFPCIAVSDDAVAATNGPRFLRTGAAPALCPQLHRAGSFYILDPVATHCLSLSPQDARSKLREVAASLLAAPRDDVRLKGVWIATLLLDGISEATNLNGEFPAR